MLSQRAPGLNVRQVCAPASAFPANFLGHQRQGSTAYEFRERQDYLPTSGKKILKPTGAAARPLLRWWSSSATVGRWATPPPSSGRRPPAEEGSVGGRRRRCCGAGATTAAGGFTRAIGGRPQGSHDGNHTR